MQFKALVKYVSYSSYKLRPIADLIRGKNAKHALDWLTMHTTRRSEPIKKLLHSAVSNAKSRANIDSKDLVIHTIAVDQGPTFRYYKSGAMGRASTQRRRFSHIRVVVEQVGVKQMKRNKE